MATLRNARRTARNPPVHVLAAMTLTPGPAPTVTGLTLRGQAAAGACRTSASRIGRLQSAAADDRAMSAYHIHV